MTKQNIEEKGEYRTSDNGFCIHIIDPRGGTIATTSGRDFIDAQNAEKIVYALNYWAQSCEPQEERYYVYSHADGKQDGLFPGYALKQAKEAARNIKRKLYAAGADPMVSIINIRTGEYV